MINTHSMSAIAGNLHVEINPKVWAARLLNWLISKDQAYKDRLHVKSLSEAHLKDAGLLR